MNFLKSLKQLTEPK